MPAWLEWKKKTGAEAEIALFKQGLFHESCLAVYKRVWDCWSSHVSPPPPLHASVHGWYALLYNITFEDTRFYSLRQRDLLIEAKIICFALFSYDIRVWLQGPSSEIVMFVVQCVVHAIVLEKGAGKKFGILPLYNVAGWYNRMKHTYHIQAHICVSENVSSRHSSHEWHLLWFSQAQVVVKGNAATWLLYTLHMSTLYIMHTICCIVWSGTCAVENEAWHTCEIVTALVSGGLTSLSTPPQLSFQRPRVMIISCKVMNKFMKRF